MAEVIPQITIDGTKIKDTWTEKEYVTDEVYNALNKTVIDLKNNNNLLDSNSILFREEYNSSSKNLNNAIHQGVYSFTNSAVNAPSGVNGGNLLVTNTSKTNQGSSIITQIAFCHNGDVYARTKDTSENFTSWNKLAYITDTISRAIADKNGLQIDTGYLKLSGGTINGNLYFNTTTAERKITGNNDVGFYISPNGNIGMYDWDSNLAILQYTKNSNSVTSITPATSDNSTKIATTNFVNNYAPSKIGAGASGTWGINISGNAGTSTKATQDNQGQQINTTYVKSVTASNDTLTVTKGNGTTSTVTVNNVAHATNSDNSTNTGNFNQGFETNGEDFPTSTFRQAILGRVNRGICARPFCGKLPTNTNISSPGIAFGGMDTHGFIQMDFESPIVYVGAGDRNQINWYKRLAITESPAFSGTPTAPTPSTSDNSTKIATTAFVKSLFTASKATNGWHKEASTGFIWQWGRETNYHDVMDKNYGSISSLNFPISFPNECLTVIPYLIGNRTFCNVSVYGYTNTAITVHWDEWANDVQSVMFGYIAVGY